MGQGRYQRGASAKRIDARVIEKCISQSNRCLVTPPPRELSQEMPLRLYRCILDGIYFRDKEAALVHLRIAHSLEHLDESLLREVEFVPEMMPRALPHST